MTKQCRFEFNATGRIESRGEYWAAYNNEFGITAYGQTCDEAEERLGKSIRMMIDRLFMRGSDAVRARFESLGLPYLLVEETNLEPPVRRFDVAVRQVRELEDSAELREPVPA